MTFLTHLYQCCQCSTADLCRDGYRLLVLAQDLSAPFPAGADEETTKQDEPKRNERTE